MFFAGWASAGVTANAADAASNVRRVIFTKLSSRSCCFFVLVRRLD
jgi:hypothetical protein